MLKNSPVIFIVVSFFGYAASAQITEKDQIRIIDSTNSANLSTTTLATGWYYVLDAPTDFKRTLKGYDQEFFINPRPILVKANFVKTELYRIYGPANYYGLKIILDKTGKAVWKSTTKKSIDRRMGFVLDNELIFIAVIAEPAKRGVTSIAAFSKEEMEAVEKQLNVGDDGKRQ